MNDNTNKIVEWTLDDVSGDVQRISLVTAPAIESDFMLFNSTEQNFKATDNDKRILTGVAMRPNINIARRDEDGELYYGFFSDETVEKAQQLFFKSGQNTNNTNLEHEFIVDDIFVFESWIVEDEKVDKSIVLGLTDIRKGDWVVSMKVDNDVVWDEFLKTGQIKGFSVEIKAQENEVDCTQETFNYIYDLLDSTKDEDEIYDLIYAKISEYGE
tara:strand:+ start:2388 stop:3029 length:642 start_codon:yes stop_codon:yes gene_type:complete